MNNIDNLLLENEALKTEINTLKQLILDLENENKKSWSTIIDEKVEIWYEKFKDDIDIGRISSFNVLGTSFEVDVLPDDGGNIKSLCAP